MSMYVCLSVCACVHVFVISLSEEIFAMFEHSTTTKYIEDMWIQKYLPALIFANAIAKLRLPLFWYISIWLSVCLSVPFPCVSVIVEM